MRIKKVLLLVAGDNGTIGSCSLNLYEAIKSVGQYEVKCAIVHHFKNGYDGFKDALFFDKENKGGLLEQIKWLKCIKDTFCPDVTISTLFGVTTLSVLSGGKDKKIGIFHSPHQQMKADGIAKYSITLAQYAFLYPMLDKLCCVSEEVKNSLSAFPWIKDEKKQVVYNVHNIERIITKSKEELSDIAEQEIFSYPTIVYCGRLDRNKAPMRAIEAFAKAQRPKNAQLVFIGDDQENLRPDLEKAAKRLNIDSQIHFLGRKVNPYQYIGRSSALISSSYSEGLPGVMIEALSLGVPVVTTNSSKGIWEIFSTSDKYDKNLVGLFESDCGIISSNISFRNPQKYQTDIENLASAIGKVFQIGKIEYFLFANSVNGETIVNQLLSDM